MAAHRPAEIEEADLAPLALELAAWGVRDPAPLRLPTQPPAGPFAQARGLLLELGALGGGRLDHAARPRHGGAAAASAAGPHDACARGRTGWAATAVAVAALLSGRDPDRDRSDADLARRLTLLRAGLASASASAASSAGPWVASPGRPTPRRSAPSPAWPSRIGWRRRVRAVRGAFRLANGRGARLDPRRPAGARALARRGRPRRYRRRGAHPSGGGPDASPSWRLCTATGSSMTAEIRFEPREEAVVARRVVRLGCAA